MLNDFDIAVTQKIKSWFSNTIYANTALVYNVAYNLVDDSSLALKFPMISIYRPSGFSLSEKQNFAAKRQGVEYLYNPESNKSGMARYLVVNLPYQIDVWTKTPESLNNIIEDIIHALSLDPTVRVHQLDRDTNESFTELYEMTYSTGPAEQSEFQNDDRVYHLSIVYDIKNARLVSFKGVNTITDVQTELDVDE